MTALCSGKICTIFPEKGALNFWKSCTIALEYSSSDLETLCDDLYMIHQGKVIMHEDTDVLLSDYALLKVDEEEYSKLDRQYILRTKKESYGYSCLTNQKQYYAENYPQIAIEKGNIDEVITMMIRGVE